MSKILVMLTGGTIGSCVQENIISAKEERSAQIVSLYEKQFGKHEEFVVVQPLNELSENLHPDNWEVMKNTLDEAIGKDFDGIIITHGSDTLAYTSAFMSLIYSWVNIPIAIVAANYPLDDPRSNGMHNFAGAVDFIKEKVITGVYTIYENMFHEVEVFLPTRMLNSDPYFDQYRSFDRQIFGWMREGRFVWNSENPVTLEAINNRNKFKNRQFDFKFKNEVAFIQTYLGIDFRNYSLGGNVKVAILSLYHSATAPATENAGLLDFIERCNNAGIEVYGASFKSPDISCYESADALLRKGMQPLFNISSVCAYVKLVLAYNQSVCDQKTMMEENIFFECLEIV